MNTFDYNKLPGYINHPLKEQQNNQQVPNKQPELKIEELVNSYVKQNSTNRINGTFLNSSDSELLSNQLEQYLPTASLRLELQIERIEKEIEKTQKTLKAFALLPDSEIKLNQQKLLLTKQNALIQNLNQYKEEYRSLGSLYSSALWLKDSLKHSKNLFNGVKNILYGKNALFINQLKQANDSMELLVTQLQNNSNLKTSDNDSLNSIQILKQFEKIETNIENIKHNYYENQGPGLLEHFRRWVQDKYYGYIIPRERYDLEYRTVKEDAKDELVVKNGLKVEKKLKITMNQTT
ncbi:MAG: hypothetical protein AB1782_12405 [Cyanobacteriota bacterium]